MTVTLDTALAVLAQKRTSIEAKHGVRLVGVVGSVARGEERADSDVDVVYEVTGRPTLFNLSDVVFELEQALGRHVDLVDLSMVRPEARDWLKQDLVLA